MHIRSRTLWHFVVVVPCLGSICIHLASAQTTPAPNATLPVVEYENGALDAQWLPYGRYWVIQGARDVRGGRADAVLVTLRGAKRVEERCWVRPGLAGAEKDTTTKFRLVLHPLTVGRTYSIKLTFYSAAVPDTLLVPVVLRGIDAALQVAKRQGASLREEQLVAIIDSQVRVDLAPAFQKSGLRHVTMPTEGQCALDAEVPKVILSPQLREDLLKAVAHDASARQSLADQENVSGQIRSLAATSAFDQVLDVLLRASKAHSASGVVPADVTDLRNRARSGQAPPADTLDRLAAASAACPGRMSLPPSQGACATFGNLMDLFSQYVGTTQDIEHSRAGANEAQLAAQAALTDAYRPLGAAQLSLASWDLNAASNDIRVGTVYAFAGSPLGLASHAKSEWNWFGFVGLKLYRYPVDKSLPEPYQGNTWARWSLVFGALLNSTLTYRGQTQAVLAAGLTPVIGVGYDTFARNVSLQFGAALFKQPSTNPAASGRFTAHAAPFVSLGFDFDAINRVKKLVSGS